MVGCVSIQSPYALVLEYVPYGSLLDYLRENRKLVSAFAVLLTSVPPLTANTSVGRPLQYHKVTTFTFVHLHQWQKKLSETRHYNCARTYICYMLHTYATCSIHMLHVTYICYMLHTYATCYIRMLHVAYICYMLHTYATCCIRMLHVAYVCYMLHTYATCYIRMLHVTYICYMLHTYATCYIRMLHVTYIRYMLHTYDTCYIHMLHVTYLWM